MTGLPAACCSRSGVDAPTFSTDCLAPAYPPYLQDPTQRLGAQAGADEVRQHPWFAGVDWALGRHSEATLARAASRAATMKRVPSKSSGMSGMGSSGLTQQQLIELQHCACAAGLQRGTARGSSCTVRITSHQPQPTPHPN